MAAEQRVGYRAGLLIDLLAHEPVVTTLLGGGKVPINAVGLYLSRLAVEGDDIDAVRGDADQLILAKLDGIAGVLDERRNIGGDEVFTLPHPDHQWGVPARRHHGVWHLLVHRDQGECATQPTTDHAHGLSEGHTRRDL